MLRPMLLVILLLLPSVASGQEAPFSSTMQDFVTQLRDESRLLPEETITIALHDLASDTRLISVDASTTFQSASLIKPFVALAFFHEVERGRFRYGPKSKANLHLMLRKSDNPATNWFIRLLGGPGRVQAILDAYYPGLASGTSVVESIPADGRTYRNRASAEAYLAYLAGLWEARLPHADEMIAAMRLPAWVESLGRVQTIHKNGYTAMACGMIDLLLPEAPDGTVRPLAFVAVIERETRAEPYLAWRNDRLALLARIRAKAVELACPVLELCK